jgi:hypothetical protein
MEERGHDGKRRCVMEEREHDGRERICDYRRGGPNW